MISAVFPYKKRRRRVLGREMAYVKFDSFRAYHFFSISCARKSPHGSTFEVVLKRLDEARIGSNRMAHLWHTDHIT
jgi:hypothetical protein